MVIEGQEMAEYNLSASSSWNGTVLRDCCVGWMEGDERSLITDYPGHG